MQTYPPNVLCPFRCLYIDMPFFRENAFLTQNFTQDRRPNGRLLAPTPLTLRGGEFATQITKTRRYAARKFLRATHVKILPGIVAVCVEEFFGIMESLQKDISSRDDACFSYKLNDFFSRGLRSREL